MRGCVAVCVRASLCRPPATRNVPSLCLCTKSTRTQAPRRWARQRLRYPGIQTGSDADTEVLRRSRSKHFSIFSPHHPLDRPIMPLHGAHTHGGTHAAGQELLSHPDTQTGSAADTEGLSSPNAKKISTPIPSNRRPSCERRSHARRHPSCWPASFPRTQAPVQAAAQVPKGAITRE